MTTREQPTRYNNPIGPIKELGEKEVRISRHFFHPPYPYWKDSDLCIDCHRAQDDELHQVGGIARWGK